LTPEAGALVQVWVTRRSEKLVRLYFASASAETGKVRYLLRDLELEHGLDEVGAEELAQAVHLSTLALLEGQLESSREEIEQALKAEPERAETVLTPPVAPQRSAKIPEKPAASSVQLSPALGYAFDFRDDEGIAHGPRLRLGVAGSSGLGLWSRLQVTLPHRAELAQLDLELWGGSLLLAPSVRRALAPRWQLCLYAGGSLELVHYEAKAKPGLAFAPSSPSNELRPRAVLGALLAFGTWPRLGLVTELGVALGKTRYESERGGERRVVAEAALLSPSAGLELEL
jgi:hypothetical protein